MIDVEQAPAGGRISSDEAELIELMRACRHWVLLAAPGVTLDPKTARPVVDDKPATAPPAVAMMKAVQELLEGGETVLLACRVVVRRRQAVLLARHMGWQVQFVPNSSYETEH